MANINNTNWLQIFDQYNVLNAVNRDGFFRISATQINQFREARLMTKFDHSNSRPQLFIDNQLAILPVTRGDYIISKFEAYKEIEYNVNNVEYLPFPENIESLDHENITSEATAINCAYISSILSNFLDEPDLLPTVNGRMSSNSFDFSINNIANNTPLQIAVNNSQIEIDGGYEGQNCLSIIEAKNYISEDFLIRQLYYPFRLWANKIQKRVRPVFLRYSNGIYSLYEYEFLNSLDYNSINLVNHKNYIIGAENITLEDICNILANITITQEPQVPFPQANSFERVINLLEILYSNNELTADEITTNYNFVSRQTDYYTNSGIYLGFIEKSNTTGEILYKLTNRGRSLFSLTIKQRNIEIIKTILSHNVFKRVLEKYFELARMPNDDEIVNIMRTSNLYNINSDSTFYRRKQTISSWINWILSHQ